MAQDRYRYFRIEARDLLEQMGQGVLEIERSGASPPVVARLLRLAHTLKGAARVVKQREIADVAHAIEDMLAPFREQTAAIPRDQIEAMLARLDEMSVRVGALGAQAEPPKEPVRASPQGAPPEEPPRLPAADLDEMDAVVDGVTEASVHLRALRKTYQPLERARRLAELLDEHLGGTRTHRPLEGMAPRVRAMAGELRSIVEGLERTVGGSVEQMERELHQTRDAAERLRLLPARVMFGALQRTARDAAQSVGRRVSFASSGGEIRLDAQVVSIVEGALVQAVRNAVAHGIEREAERRAAGKPADGHVSLEVKRRGKRVVFFCKDDGRGLDLDAVRDAAARRGLLSAETAELDAESTIELLLRGGITTSSSVTEISGRGVGLDVVREAASRLGGEVRVQTERGEGTTVELAVPVSLSAFDALVVESAGHVAAVPLDAVTRAMRLEPSDFSKTAEGVAIVFEDRPIPFLSLDRVLHVLQPAQERRTAVSVVVIRAATGMVALGVERLRGTESVVVRPLPAHTPAEPTIAGASFDGEGNPRIVLDPDGLVAEAARATPARSGPDVEALPILVIDDSLTTRMLEQSILESAGYEVDLAVSGEEGLEKARKRRYALFLVDVEMPGIDGFEFVERTRADPALHGTPAILVTSRASPEDRERGKRAGAAAHIAKTGFDQTELLSNIRRLVRPK
jgi:two-component system chemotaxis sensor kinase CheA